MFRDKYIFLKKNTLSKNQCQKIINSIDQLNLNKTPYYYGIGSYDLSEYNPLIIDTLLKNLTLYKKNNNILETFNLKINLDFNFQKYEPNQSYSVEHFEQNNLKHTSRMVVWMFYLNTIKRGGGTYWPQQNYKSKANAGDLIIWPASWTHSHCGIVAPLETKYIITGWCDLV